MKMTLLTSLLGVALLAGCESTSVNTASGPRTIDLPGTTNGRTTAVIPANDAAASSDAPYALRGDAPSPAVVNYFNSPAFPHGSTNGN